MGIRVIFSVIFASILVLIYVGCRNWSFKRAMLSGDGSGVSSETAEP